jgi:hypothetical protein
MVQDNFLTVHRCCRHRKLPGGFMLTISLMALLFLVMGTITFVIGSVVNSNRKRAVPVFIRNDVYKRRRLNNKDL